jgi:hypothetical protein
MNRKRLQSIVSLSFVAVLILAWLMCGQGPSAFGASAGNNDVNSSTKFAFPQINQTNRFKPHHEKENEQ